MSSINLSAAKFKAVFHSWNVNLNYFVIFHDISSFHLPNLNPFGLNFVNWFGDDLLHETKMVESNN